MFLFGGLLAAQRKSQLQGIAATTGRLRMGVLSLPMFRGRYRWTSRIPRQSAAVQQEIGRGLGRSSHSDYREDPEEQTKVVCGVTHPWENSPHSSHRCRRIAQKRNCQGLHWHAMQVPLLKCLQLSPTTYHLFISTLGCQIVLYNPTSVFHEERPPCLILFYSITYEWESHWALLFS